VLLARYECSLGNLNHAKKWLKKAKGIVGKEAVRRITIGDSDFVPLQSYIKSAFWW